MKKNFSRPDAETGTTTAKQMTKKSVLKKVDSTMVETLIDFENCKINTLSEILEIVNDEDVIEQCKQAFQNEENHFVLGGRFNQYVLTYDEFNHIIEFTDENSNEICFGVNIQNIDPDGFVYFYTACCINDKIEEYFGDRIIEDCGEFWEIKE